jgi:anaerobic nitric oxide reductase transcription regulator
MLVGYSWPGNVRELEHLISRGVLKALSVHRERPRILTIDGKALGLDTEVAPPGSTTIAPMGGEAVAVNPGEGLKDAVDAYQKLLITQTLERHQGKWADAARELNLDRANLSRLAKRLGIR